MWCLRHECEGKWYKRNETKRNENDLFSRCYKGLLLFKAAGNLNQSTNQQTFHSCYLHWYQFLALNWNRQPNSMTIISIKVNRNLRLWYIMWYPDFFKYLILIHFDEERIAMVNTLSKVKPMSGEYFVS